MSGLSMRGLFGVALHLRRSVAQRHLEGLETAWLLQFDRPMSTLWEDLELLFEGLFDPFAREATLRDRLVGLRLSPVTGSDLPEQVYLPVGDRGGLVTPEGRTLAECLRTALQDPGDPVYLDEAATAAGLHELAACYSRIAGRRLRSVIELAEGRSRLLQPPALAVVVFLLLNHAVGPARAIRRPKTAEQMRRLDDAAIPVMRAFADALLPSERRDPGHMSLKSGYGLTEAKRRLPQIRVEKDPDTEGHLIYIRDQQGASEAIDFLARDLRRRTMTAGSVHQAFDALLEEYRRQEHRLAVHGVAHLDPVRTDALRQQLTAPLEG